jgi:hypothetical protein
MPWAIFSVYCGKSERQQLSQQPNEPMITLIQPRMAMISAIFGLLEDVRRDLEVVEVGCADFETPVAHFVSVHCGFWATIFLMENVGRVHGCHAASA